MNSTDQGVVWSGATSFYAPASWFVCLSCNALLLFSSLRGAWAEERLLRAQGILLIIRGGEIARRAENNVQRTRRRQRAAEAQGNPG